MVSITTYLTSGRSGSPTPNSFSMKGESYSCSISDGAPRYSTRSARYWEKGCECGRLTRPF